ncbi:MAG TPA: hypothetical protein VKS00_05420 [Candidatus Acidoferrales bacterium]|nr:hypothetical protein [Candidatus Acidoferrales bacterium]
MSFLDAVKRAIGHTVEKQASGFRPGGDDAIDRLVRELAVCPVCGKEFSGHAIALFAHTVLGEKNHKRAGALFEVVDDRRWKDLQKFQEWNARGANAEIYVVCCVKGDAAVAILHSSPTPAEFKNVERCACVGGNSARELLALIPPHAWKPITFTARTTDSILPT